MSAADTSDACGPGLQNQSLTQADASEPVGDLTLAVRTLGGQEVRLDGLAATTSMIVIKRRLAEVLAAPIQELRLISGTTALHDESLKDAGLDFPGAFVVLVRICEGHALNDSLMKAIAEARDDEARRLIDRGAGLDKEGRPARDATGSPVLHLALRAGLVDLAHYLIRMDADIHATSEMQRQPLAVASIKGLDTVVEALLRARADPAHTDMVGKTAYDYAFRKGSLAPDILAQLRLQHGA